jgi:hypothetical protein
MSTHSTGASRSTFRVDQVGEAVQMLGAPLRTERSPGGNAACAAATARSASRSPAAGDLGERLRVDRARVGERRVAPTRSPPMKWSVETSTPATTGHASPRERDRAESTTCCRRRR